MLFTWVRTGALRYHERISHKGDAVTAAQIPQDLALARGEAAGVGQLLAAGGHIAHGRGLGSIGALFKNDIAPIALPWGQEGRGKQVHEVQGAHYEQCWAAALNLEQNRLGRYHAEQGAARKPGHRRAKDEARRELRGVSGRHETRQSQNGHGTVKRIAHPSGEPHGACRRGKTVQEDQQQREQGHQHR